MAETMLTLQQAISLSRDEVRKHYAGNVNPTLASLLGLLDFDKRFIKAQGVSVWDADGREYLDFLGGYGALNTGHNHPAIVGALEAVRDVPNLLQASLSPMAAALAHNLAVVTPGDLKMSFFGNSGAEAVEGALKLARAATRKVRFLHADDSFHGKSFGALSVTGRRKYQEPFEPLVPGVSSVPFGQIESLEKELQAGNVAAFIVEPIQGEGGVIVPPEGYLKQARDLCTRYGALLIADEIQTGFGRTGAMFACEHEGVVPDIMCVAKSLGGGVMPIGAYITTERIWKEAYGKQDRSLLHTSTFGGNTRAAAVGIAAIHTVVDEKLPERARVLGDRLLEGLRVLKEKHSMIKDVRGRGLLVGIEFERPAQGVMARMGGELVNKFAEEYLAAMVAGELMNRHRVITAYTLNNPNVIRLEPPLVVSQEQIDQVLNALDDIFARHPGVMGMALSSVKTALGSAFRR